MDPYRFLRLVDADAGIAVTDAIRRTLDCLIATVCIREQCPILHNDRDFDHLADVTALTVHGTAAPGH